MKKDEQSLLRMNFLIQAASMYHSSSPPLSSHFVYDFIQISEKKMIRIDKKIKKMINKKTFTLKQVERRLGFQNVSSKETHPIAADPYNMDLQEQNQ